MVIPGVTVRNQTASETELKPVASQANIQIGIQQIEGTFDAPLQRNLVAIGIGQFSLEIYSHPRNVHAIDRRRVLVTWRE